jgi:hypothetical protein
MHGNVRQPVTTTRSGRGGGWAGDITQLSRRRRDGRSGWAVRFHASPGRSNVMATWRGARRRQRDGTRALKPAPCRPAGRRAARGPPQYVLTGATCRTGSNTPGGRSTRSALRPRRPPAKTGSRPNGEPDEDARGRSPLGQLVSWLDYAVNWAPQGSRSGRSPPRRRTGTTPPTTSDRDPQLGDGGLRWPGGGRARGLRVAARQGLQHVGAASRPSSGMRNRAGTRRKPRSSG